MVVGIGRWWKPQTNEHWLMSYDWKAHAVCSSWATGSRGLSEEPLDKAQLLLRQTWTLKVPVVDCWFMNSSSQLFAIRGSRLFVACGPSKLPLAWLSVCGSICGISKSLCSDNFLTIYGSFLFQLA